MDEGYVPRWITRSITAGCWLSAAILAMVSLFVKWFVFPIVAAGAIASILAPILIAHLAEVHIEDRGNAESGVSSTPSPGVAAHIAQESPS